MKEKELIMLINRVNNRRGAELAWENGSTFLSIEGMKHLLAYIREKIGSFSVRETENFASALAAAQLYSSKSFARNSLRFVLELPDESRDAALESLKSFFN